MKFKLLVLITILSTCSIACDNTKKDSEKETTQTESQVEDDTSDTKLELNNGKRWVANKETTEGVNNMIQLTNTFTDFEDIDSYKELEASLQSEFTTIFKKCTMKGESHNQLHNFLLPLKNKFDELSSNDLTKSKTTVDDLKKHLLIYNEYFE